MTVLTAFVVSLVFGMLISDSALVRSIMGTEKVPVARNDVFYVNSGKPGTLDVLANDTDIAGVPQIRLLRGPECGTASVLEDEISFTPGETCSGTQDMMYCIAHDDTCIRANITVTVLERPVRRTAELEAIKAPTAMIEAPTANIVLAGSDINEDEPISGFVVELAEHGAGDAGRRANDIRGITALFQPIREGEAAAVDSSAPLVPVADIALDPKKASTFLRSYETEAVTSDPAATLASETFEARGIQLSPNPVGRIATAAFVPSQDGTAARPDPQYAPGGVPGGGEGVIDLPPLVEEMARKAEEEAAGGATAALVVEVAPQQQKPVTPLRHRPKHPPSEFVATPSAPCEASGMLAIRPGAHLRMTLGAECLAGKLVELQHGGVKFVHKVSETGELLTSIPAVANALDVAVFLQGEELGRYPIKGDHGGDLARVLVTVPVGTAQIEVVETGANGGETKRINTDRIIPHREAVAEDRGYMRRYRGNGSNRVYSYTLPVSEVGAARSVEVQLVGTNTSSICGQTIKVAVLENGQRRAAFRNVTMPDCGSEQVATVGTYEIGPSAQLK